MDRTERNGWLVIGIFVLFLTFTVTQCEFQRKQGDISRNIEREKTARICIQNGGSWVADGCLKLKASQ